MAKIEDMQLAYSIATRLNALRYMRKTKTTMPETVLQVRLYAKGSPEPIEKFKVEPYEIDDFLASVEAKMLAQLAALGVTE